MDEEIQKPEPKISEVEIVLIGLFYITLDAIDLIPIAGELTDIAAAPMGFYYWMKGLNATTFIVAEVLDLVPVVQAFPSRSVSWGITVWLDRHPKLEGRLEAAVKIAEGDIEGVEELAAEQARGGTTPKTEAGQTLNMTQTESGEVENPAENDENAAEKKEGLKVRNVNTGGRMEEDTEESEEERKKREAGEDTENMPPIGAEIPWEKVEHPKFFGVENTDASRARVEWNKSKGTPEGPNNKVTSIDRNEKAREVREQLDKPKQAQNVVTDDKVLDKAA